MRGQQSTEELPEFATLIFQPFTTIQTIFQDLRPYFVFTTQNKPKNIVHLSFKKF